MKVLTETSAANATPGQVMITIGIWILAIVCIPIMKKLEPDNKIYPVWALIIALMLSGIGKSTFASRFPEPVFIDTEDSTNDMDVARFDKPTSWQMLLQEVQFVINNPNCCKTLVIDTADWAEQIEITELCDKKGWSGLEDAGYRKGYQYSADEFGKLLNKLSEVIKKNVNVVITAHAQFRKIELPDELGAYDHWEMKTSKKVAPMIKEWCDALLFANYKTLVVNVDGKGAQKGKNKAQGGRRVMYTSHHPCWDAKNRYGLPEELPFEYESIRHIIEPQSTVTLQETPPPEVVPPVRTGTPKVETPAPDQEKRTTPPVEEQVLEKKIDNTEIVTEDTLDKRIPGELRDLMLASAVGEWSLQAVVQTRLPGAFPDDMEVKDYPQDFIDEWIMPNWDKIVECAKEIREKMEIPFN